jgi:hypothetical protein
MEGGRIMSETLLNALQNELQSIEGEISLAKVTIKVLKSKKKKIEKMIRETINEKGEN